MGMYDDVIEQIGKAGEGAPPPAASTAPPAPPPPAASVPPAAPPPTDPAEKGMYEYSDAFRKAYGKQ